MHYGGALPSDLAQRLDQAGPDRGHPSGVEEQILRWDRDVQDQIIQTTFFLLSQIKTTCSDTTKHYSIVFKATMTTVRDCHKSPYVKVLS